MAKSLLLLPEMAIALTRLTTYNLKVAITLKSPQAMLLSGCSTKNYSHY